MSCGTSSSHSGGIGFTGALQLLFIGLKLGGVIDWSWWAVMSPTLIGVALVGFILVILIIAEAGK